VFNLYSQPGTLLNTRTETLTHPKLVFKSVLICVVEIRNYAHTHTEKEREKEKEMALSVHMGFYRGRNQYRRSPADVKVHCCLQTVRCIEEEGPGKG
jgi:hypothetical protein